MINADKPLLMCSTLFNIKQDIPYHIDVVTHHNERKSLVESHINVLHSGDTVIADRGYYSSDVCKRLTAKKIDLLFRVKEKASSTIFKFVTSRRTERICIGHAVTRLLVDSSKVVMGDCTDKTDNIVYEYINLPAFRHFALSLFKTDPRLTLCISESCSLCIVIPTRRVII
jgi:hypothetical protein